MHFTKQELDELFTANIWNESRLRKSFANKQELVLLNECCRVEEEGLHFDVSFEQVHEDAYGFAVHACIELAQDKSCFLAYLFKEGNRRPLHKPVRVPLKYGFQAQANQLLTAAIGLMYVYNVAGVEDLDYYPDGMKSW